MNRFETQEEPASRDEQAADWCLQLSEGHLPPDDRNAFDRWMEDPDNAAAFDDALAIWQASGASMEWPEAIEMRTEALGAFRDLNARRWSETRTRGRYIQIAIAASLLLAMGIALAFVSLSPVSYETSIGERRIVMLEDGSRLSLDAASQVDVRLREDRRELTLTRGRAKFDVAHNPLRPFTVRAGNRLVVATGTSFSVELIHDEVRVVLFEGSVDVLEDGSSVTRMRGRPAETATVTRMSPGTELIANVSSLALAASDLHRAGLWEIGQLSFEEERLDSAVERMNRYSATKIEFDPGIAGMRVDGVFNAGDVDAFVEGVATLYPIEILRGEGRVTLKSN